MDNKIAIEQQKTPDILSWVSEQDVTSLRHFLTDDIARLLLCIGSGGPYSTCELVALAYGVNGGIAKSLTPYSVYALDESILAKCKVLLISNSGHNKDIVAIAKVCMKLNPKWTANLSTADGPRNDLKSIVAPENSFNYKSNIKDGFISVNSVTANYALILRAFGKTQITSDIEKSETTPNFATINHFIVLYGGWGEPAAIDFESKLVERGTATCAVSDFRNFCHGRFIFPGNHSGHEKKAEVPADCAVVMLSTPREKPLVDRLISLLPDRCNVIHIHCDFTDSLAALDLLLKASNLAGEIAFSKDIDPINPKNYSNIDKRKPLQIHFISDLKAFGPMKI